MLRRCLLLIPILGAQANPLRAQVMIGYGAVSGQSAVASGAAAGKAAAGVLGKLSQTLTGAAKPSDASKPVAPPAQPALAAPEPTPAPPADFSGLTIGMDREDLVKKVGKPSMSISSVESSVLVENCSYRNGAGTVAITLRDGKVAAITGAGELSVH